MRWIWYRWIATVVRLLLLMLTFICLQYRQSNNEICFYFFPIWFSPFSCPVSVVCKPGVGRSFQPRICVVVFCCCCFFCFSKSKQKKDHITFSQSPEKRTPTPKVNVVNKSIRKKITVTLIPEAFSEWNSKSLLIDRRWCSVFGHCVCGCVYFSVLCLQITTHSARQFDVYSVWVIWFWWLLVNQ